MEETFTVYGEEPTGQTYHVEGYLSFEEADDLIHHMNCLNSRDVFWAEED